MSTKYTTWHRLCRILRVFILHACAREFQLKMRQLAGCDNNRHSVFRTTDLLNILQGGSNMTGTDLCVNKCK